MRHPRPTRVRLPGTLFFSVFSTLGFTFSAAAPAPARAAVVINEVHYDPADETRREEFIELFNPGPSSADLSGWFFSSAIAYRFAEGTTIPAGGFLLVAEDPATLEASFAAPGALGPWQGRLSNRGETIRLRDRAGRIVDEVDYRSRFPWPSAPHGGGSSMELIHPSLPNELGGSWRASGLTSGLPPSRVPLLEAGAGGWRYRKGTSEASSPRAAWRAPDFREDATWLAGRAPIGYGDGDDATVLDDMRGNYSSLYLRRELTVDPAAELPPALALGLYVDDGAVVWLNGVEVFRLGVSAGDPPHDGLAANHEAAWTEVILPPPAAYLRPGRNVLAIQVLNGTLASSDLSIDATLFVPSASDFGGGSAGGPPSPGRPNSALSASAPPAVRAVAHFPHQPRSGEPVGVEARVSDPDGVAEVTLELQVVEPGAYIRLGDPEYATEWTSYPMNDAGEGADRLAGDGLYTALVPASVGVHRRLVRYRISASDATGLSVRVPYSDDPQPNFAWFVSDGVPGWRGASRPGVTPVLDFPPEVTASLPVYWLLARAEDVTNCQYNSSYRQTLFSATMVYEGEVYDHIRFEIRGEFSTYVSGKNKWRFHFNRGHEFRARDVYGRRNREPWRKMNFSACATPWVPTNRGMAGLGTAVAFRAYELAGVPSPRTAFVSFRVVDEALEASPSDQYRGDLWGLYLTVEHTDGPFLRERGLPDGNVYKIERGGGDKRHQGPTQPAGTSDYDALKSGYNRSEPIDWWRSNVELEVYYDFRGVNRAVNNMDLREGWNLAQYHDPDTDRWSVIPWDLDMLYMPVTHWSGVMNFQNALSQHAELAMEYRNRCRELLDLLFTPDQFGAMVLELAVRENPPGEPLTMVDADEAMWNYHPRTSGNHRGAFYRNPSTHTARGGTITRTLVSADHEGMAQWIADFALRGYGHDQLVAHARDGAIPSTPDIEYTGAPGFPIDALRFRSGPFDDPQGPDTFGAMEWRAGRIAARGTPLLDPEGPRPYEIEPVWESGVIEELRPEIAIPAEALAVGERYRVRVRHRDTTGRWSHWSRAVELTAAEPWVPFPAAGSLRVTELMYHPEGGDEELEFVELANVGAAELDLAPISFAGGIEFRFADAAVTSLAPDELVLVVRDRTVFEARYGAGLPVAGEFSGSLSNSGERVTLVHGQNSAVLDFEYSDAWHPLTDGAGLSLVASDPWGDPSNWSLAEGWRESAERGGSPGRFDAEPPPGGFRLPGDLNGDGAVDLSDAVRLLLLLYVPSSGQAPPCGDATVAEGGSATVADFDSSGRVDLSDAIGVLSWLYRSGPPPALGTRCVRIEGCESDCGR